jgi:hypothetical protein
VSRTVPLTVVQDGINRQRIKGGARADSLYDLLNGYVTESKTVKVRPGTTRMETLPETTKGLCYFEDELYVFSHQQETVPYGYVNVVLVNPNDQAQLIEEIHFAEPFMGFLYVVAEFANGEVFHYWLQSSGTWQASTVYLNGAIVTPTTPNGLAYRATRIGSPYPSWAPSVPRAVSDIIEPTTYNGYYYTVVDTIGANPASGLIEPTWPTEDGAQVSEDTEGEIATSPTVTEPPIDQPPEDTQDRYGPFVNPRSGGGV